MRKLLLLTLCLSSFIGLAQNGKPKLALVLSGGGAKGLAHVGVLKAMEEAGIRPDFIAGTSMGSIVGGLYAIGYSPHEIDSILRVIDWDQVLSNKMPLNYIAFEEKEYYDRYLVNFPLVDYRPKIGTGLIRGQRLNELMHFYFWPALQYEHFDEFPIPFRCVATNVGTGDPMVFESGSLPSALRASMAIPTAFTAVKRDSTLLVDGGVVNNFPVELAQEWGADYVIGVNVGAQLKPELPDNMPEILMTLSMIPANKKLSEQAKTCDIYIEPNLQSYDAASFGDALEIMAVGDSTGNLYGDEFKALGRTIGRTAEFSKIGSTEKAITIKEIEIKGNRIFSNELILNKLKIVAGQTILRQDLLMGLRRVYGINGLKEVDYEIYRNEEDAFVLKLDILEREQNYLYAGLHVDNIFGSGLSLNFTSRDLLGKESRSVFALDFSANPRFRFDYYKYLQQYKRWAFNFRYDYGALQIPSYTEGELRNIRISFTSRLHAMLMSTQSLKESYAGGIFFQNSRSRIRIGSDIPDGLQSSVQRDYGFRLMHTANDLNDRNYPNQGGESLLIINTYLGTRQSVRLEDGVDSVALNFQSGQSAPVYLDEVELENLARKLNPGVYMDVMVSARYFINIRPKIQWIPFYAVGLTIGGGAPNSVVSSFRLGGIPRVQQSDIRVMGLQFGEVISPNFSLLGIQLQHVLWDDLYLRYGFNLLAHHPYRSLKDWGSILASADYQSFTGLAGFGAELRLRTFFGPVSAGLSSNNLDWQARFYLGLGFSFNYSD